MSLPMITFSLSPRKESTLPAAAASVSTLLVWINEAAAKKLSLTRDDFVIPSFVRQIVAIENKQQKSIKVGDLSQERDFIDIRDTCKAYEILLEKGVIGEIYNIGSGKFYSIQSILDLIIKYSNLNPDKVQIDKQDNLFSNENCLSKRLYSDITKLKSLGFEPTITICKTIQDILEYWRKKDVQ